VKKMKTDEGVEMPRRQTLHSCGYDFYAPHDIDIVPGEWVTIDTGVRFDGTEVLEYPMGPVAAAWLMIVGPRSGLGTKYRVRLANTLGFIDQDYRDNILMSLTADVQLHIEKGERIAQLVIQQVPKVTLVEVDELDETDRGQGGFGSSGV
jgi:dUTP pyrophosphatase